MTFDALRAAHPPLLVRPRYELRPWGGRRLESELGRNDLPPGPVGESWEVGDLDGWTSQVEGGLFDGRPLPEVLGRRFPLLLKVLDAQQDLSIQVHPDGRDGTLAKEEAWVSLAEGGAVALASGRWSEPLPRAGEWMHHLQRVSLRGATATRPASLLHVPPGTVHAVLAGALVFEVQNAADITWRLDDHGRLDALGLPRALHVEAARPLLLRGAAPAAYCPPGAKILKGQRFWIRLLPPGAGSLPKALAAFLPLGGQLRSEAGDVFDVPPGRTVVLPDVGHAVDSDGWVVCVGQTDDSVDPGV